MDNVVQAIFLAFAMFVLVIGLSMSAYLINSMNTAAKAVIRSNDKTLDYQTVSYDSSSIKNRGKYSVVDLKTRTVSADVVVSTIYRYYKENFAVEIRDKDGNLNQLFDLSVETKLNKGVTIKYDDPNVYDKDGNVKSVEDLNPTTNVDWLSQAYENYYNSNAKDPYYMWGAPWLTSAKDIEQRIDLYVSSKKGYIADKLVNYKDNDFGFKKLLENGTTNFKEEFIQYSFSGETFTDINGEDVETLVGDRQELKKILIIYTQQKN